MQDLQDMCKIYCKVLHILQEKYLQYLLIFCKTVVTGFHVLLLVIKNYYIRMHNEVIRVGMPWKYEIILASQTTEL